MRRYRGITLAEILIVIAIIGVLSAVIFSVVHQVRLRATSASDASKARQIATALLIYAQASDDRLPPWLTDSAYSALSVAERKNFVTLAMRRDTIGITAELCTVTSYYVGYSREVETLPTCDFNHDYIAGVRGLSVSSIPTSTTLAFPSIPENARGDTFRIPCIRYDLSSYTTTANLCDEGTTWIR